MLSMYMDSPVLLELYAIRYRYSWQIGRDISTERTQKIRNKHIKDKSPSLEKGEQTSNGSIYITILIYLYTTSSTFCFRRLSPCHPPVFTIRRVIQNSGTETSKLHIRLTLRFVPFLPSSLPFAAALPLPFLSSSFDGPDGLGFEEKNPSNRPCCFALMYLVSFSAPLRTRSSLYQSNKYV